MCVEGDRYMGVLEVSKRIICVTIPGELPTLNEYIAVERGNKYAAAKMKKEYTQLVAFFVRWCDPMVCPVKVMCHWHCKNKRKDPDGITLGLKFILDGLVLAGVLPNDTWAWIRGIEHKFAVDKNNPRVDVELREIADES